MPLPRFRLARTATLLGAAVVLTNAGTGPAWADPTPTPLLDCFGNRIVIGPGSSVIYAQPGVDTHGTNGDDVIIGTTGDDNIYAYSGDDIVCGGRGNDNIYGGNSYDDPGVDHLDGEKGRM